MKKIITIPILLISVLILSSLASAMEVYIAVDEDNIVRCIASERENIHKDKEHMPIYYVERKGTVGDEYNAETDTWVPHPENYPQQKEKELQTGVLDKVSNDIAALKAENEALKQLVCLDHPEAEVCKKGVEPVNETPSEETLEVPVEEAPAEEIPVNPVNSVPVIDSFMPDVVPVMSVGDSQEFTVNSSDADSGDVLSLQWYINDLPVAEQTQASFTFTATEIGEFEVKVLVADGKDYATHKWPVTVTQPQAGGFSITGAAVGIARQGSSLWDWLRGLF